MYSAEHRFTNLLMTDCLFHLQFAKWRCSTLIAKGPVPLRATVAILSVSKHAKGDDLKQIVELPALNLSVSAGLTATTDKYTKRHPAGCLLLSSKFCRLINLLQQGAWRAAYA